MVLQHNPNQKEHNLHIAALCGALVVCLSAPVLGAVRGDQVMYVGGTQAHIPEKTEGRLDRTDPTALAFVAKEMKFMIPYERLTSLEYGQKAGRRVGVALAVSPVALFSKKRKHFVSIAYVDNDGAKQGVVLEVAKGIVHSFVTELETRSGKKTEFESEEARKHFEKEAK